MRNIKKVQIDEMFVHILDNRKPELIPSDFPIQFGGNQALMDYFTGHISSSLSDTSAKAARFKNINPNEASGICEEILSGKTTLAAGSKCLAQLLFDIIKKDQRISPADMAVCLYKDADEPNESYLAILKIDPSEVFQHVITRKNRKVSITYQVNNDALTKEKLQKCAFIQTLDPRNPEFDMLLLDRQTVATHDGIIAQFFAERFLGAVNAFDATKRTLVFYKTVMDAFNKLRVDLSPEVSQDLDQRLTTAIGGRSINVSNWLNDLPVEDNVREDLREQIHEKITDLEFQTDPQIGGKFASRLIYQGDYGFKLTIPAGHFDDLIQPIRKIKTPEGEVNEIIIRTKAWNTVSR